MPLGLVQFLLESPATRGRTPGESSPTRTTLRLIPQPPATSQLAGNGFGGVCVCSRASALSWRLWPSACGGLPGRLLFPPGTEEAL